MEMGGQREREGEVKCGREIEMGSKVQHGTV